MNEWIHLHKSAFLNRYFCNSRLLAYEIIDLETTLVIEEIFNDREDDPYGSANLICRDLNHDRVLYLYEVEEYINDWHEKK